MTPRPRPEWFERLHEYVRQDAIHDTRIYESDDPLPRLADDVLRALACIEDLEGQLADARDRDDFDPEALP